MIVLLENGADVNAHDSDGRTALQHVAWSGHKDSLNVLFQNGADTKAQDNDGQVALRHAAQNAHKDIMIVLLENGERLTTLVKQHCIMQQRTDTRTL